MPRSSSSMVQSVVTDLVRQLGEDPKAVAAMVREELGGAGTVELHGQQATDAVTHLWQANPQDWRTREAKRLGGPQFWDEIITRATPPEYQDQVRVVREKVKEGMPYLDALSFAASQARMDAPPAAPPPMGMPPEMAAPVPGWAGPPAAPTPMPPPGLPVQTIPTPPPPSQPVVVTRPAPMPGGM